MHRHILTLAAASLILSGSLAAQETVPEIASAINADSPYGSGSLRKFIFHAYDAELWTDATRWSYTAPFALTLTYRMNFSTDELVEKTIEEMERLHKTGSEWKQELVRAFPNVKDGDRITALFLPKKGVRFFYNGTITHTVKEVAFAQMFFDIWLSENTSEPSVRKKLLNL